MKRLAGVLLVLLVVLGGLWLLRGPQRRRCDARTVELVATLRSEPRSLNRLLAGDRASLVASQLIHEPLVRVNHVTQALEPALAASWTVTDGGRLVRLTLRPDARFSDGSPVTAADVVFSLAAVHDPRLGSPLADSLRVNGAPLDGTRPRCADGRAVVPGAVRPWPPPAARPADSAERPLREPGRRRHARRRLDH